MGLKVYLAAPISGLSGAEVTAYFEEWDAYLKKLGYQVVHPMLGKDYLRTAPELKAHSYASPVATNHAILGRDSFSVGWCDIFFVNFLRAPEKVSIGSVAELAMAWWQHKHTIAVLTEQNIHYHSFVIEMSNIIFPTEGEAVTYFADLAVVNAY